MLVEHLAHLGRGGNAVVTDGAVLSLCLGKEQPRDCGCGEKDDSILHFHIEFFLAAKAALFICSGLNTPPTAKPLKTSSGFSWTPQQHAGPQRWRNLPAVAEEDQGGPTFGTGH
jgi:hypothetical protein